MPPKDKLILELFENIIHGIESGDTSLMEARDTLTRLQQQIALEQEEREISGG